MQPPPSVYDGLRQELKGTTSIFFRMVATVYNRLPWSLWIHGTRMSVAEVK